jgi:hypothetical protein
MNFSLLKLELGSKCIFLYSLFFPSILFIILFIIPFSNIDAIYPILDPNNLYITTMLNISIGFVTMQLMQVRGIQRGDMQIVSSKVKR